MPFFLTRPSLSWQQMLALFTVVSLIEGVTLSHVSSFLPLHLLDLGIAESDVPRVLGRIVAVSSAVGLPFVPLWGALADRYARQPVIVRSFLFYLASFIIMTLAGSLWIFVLGRALMSFSMGNTGLMLTTLTERAPPSRSALMFSIVSGAIPVGMLLGPLIGGPVVDKWGFTTLITIDAFFIFSVVVAMSFGYRDDFVGKPGRSILRMTVDSIRIIVGSRVLRLLFLALFLMFTALDLSVIYTPVAITRLYTGSDEGTAIGIVLSVAGVATLILGPTFGVLADKYGRWRMLLIIVSILTVLWSTPALATGLVSFTLLLAAVNGVASGGVAIAFSVLASSASENIRGRVMSLSTMPLIIGFLVGPAIGSVVTQKTVFAVYPLAAASTLLSLGVLIIAARRAQSVAGQGM